MSYKKRRQRQRQWRRVSPTLWIGGVIAVIVLVGGIGAWQSRPSAQAAPAPPPSRNEDPADLLPLTRSGSALRGGHDMALIPKRPPAPQEAPIGVPVPLVDLPSTAYDFGPVDSSWDLTHIFAIQNTGDADLVLGNLVTSCGCTVAELSSTAIPPGERAELTVIFDADFHPTSGPVTRLVWFATNDVTQPWIELRIDADVN